MTASAALILPLTFAREKRLLLPFLFEFALALFL